MKTIFYLSEWQRVTVKPVHETMEVAIGIECQSRAAPGRWDSMRVWLGNDEMDALLNAIQRASKALGTQQS